MKDSKNLIQITVISGQETTTTKHIFDTQNGYEQIAAIEIALSYLQQLKKTFLE